MLVLGIKYLVIRLRLKGWIRRINRRGKASIFTREVDRHTAGPTFGKFSGIAMEGLITMGAIIFTFKNCLVKSISLMGKGWSMLRNKRDNKFQGKSSGFFTLGH